MLQEWFENFLCGFYVFFLSFFFIFIFSNIIQADHSDHPSQKSSYKPFRANFQGGYYFKCPVEYSFTMLSVSAC